MTQFSDLPQSDLTDDGGRLLEARLCVTSDLTEAVRGAVQAGWAVMPAGGLTSAINSFAHETGGAFAGVVAIRPKSAAQPELVDAATPLEALAPHQIAIDAAASNVAVGAGVTFAQVNAVLGHMVGSNARVLVDLTSVASAMAGGVMATGGMGPMRLRPSATCLEVALADGGEKPRLIRGEEILAIEGMQGWTGLVTAMRMRYFETPMNEFGLVLPIQSGDLDAAADFLTYLHGWTEIAIPAEGSALAGERDESTILNGVELVARASLEEFIALAPDSMRAKAENLLQSCDYAGSDWLACLTGWSDHPVDDVLALLLDSESETIGGVIIDFGVGFSSGSEMDAFRAIREGAPDVARSRARIQPPGKLKPWTASTDINLKCPRDSSPLANALSAYEMYRQGVAELGEKMAGKVDVTMSVYGHLNPHGLDPHHRVIISASPAEAEAFAQAQAEAALLKKRLLRNLMKYAEAFGAEITGGEKGIPSVIELLRAADDEAKLQPGLKQALERARQAIAQAPASFTFRAPKELRP